MSNHKDRLSLENRLSKVEARLEEIATNHLPHLEIAINAVKDKIDRSYWFAITSLLGIVTALILLLLK